MVYDKVVKIIAENLGIEESAITPESVLTDDLGADSLDFVPWFAKAVSTVDAICL